MSVSTQIPDTGTPLYDAGGYINPVWHQFFFTLLRRTGGTAGSDSESDSASFSASVQAAYSEAAQEYEAQLIPVQRDFEQAPEVVCNHGRQSDADLHEPATTSSNGFMSAADKAKIDTVTLPVVAPSALVADVITQNTTADGPILSLVMPAGSMVVGTTVALKLCGLITSAASAGTLSVWVKVGATKVMTQTFTLPAAAQAGTGLFYSALLTARTAGAGGTLQISSLMTSNGNALNAGPAVGSASAALDATVANTLTIGWNWSVASAGNIATAKNATILLEKQQ